MNTRIKDFASIEKQLDSFLRPVNPEENFAAKLKNRLLIEPEVTLEKPDYPVVMALIGSIFFTGVLVVWILYRLVNKKSE
jgi:hypothetical protein